LCDAEHSILWGTAPKGFLEAFQSVSRGLTWLGPMPTSVPARPAAVLCARLQQNSHSLTASEVRLHLRETTIYKQFRSRDVAAVVGGKKYHGLGDLIGCTQPAE